MNGLNVPDSPAREALPIGILAAAGFLSSAGARVIDPLLAVISGDFNVSVAASAVFVAAFTLAYGFSQLLLGPVGDRVGKLRLMFVALCGYALFTGACSLATNLPTLTLARALAGAASAGLIPSCLAYIGDAVPFERRNLAISKFLVGIVLAQILAGPLGGVFGQFVGWRGVFLLLSAASVVVAGVLRRAMRHAPETVGGKTFNPSLYGRLARNSNARLLLMATLVEGAVMIGVFPFVAPFLHQEFDLPFATVGLVLACFGIGALVYTRTAPRLIPALGESGLIAVGGGLIVLGLVGAMLARRWEAFVGIEGMLGLGYFMLHPVLQTRASELLPDARATSVSVFVFVLFLGSSLGAMAFGAAIAAFGYRAGFGANAVIVSGLTLWLYRFVRDRPV